MAASARRSISLAVALVLLGASVSAQPAADGVAPEVYRSDDGLLIIRVPDGASPPGIEIRAMAKTAEEQPPELGGMGKRVGSYELLPDDLSFDRPVSITQIIPLDARGFDVGADGVPLTPLVLRAVDGTWQWLDDQVVEYDLDSGALRVSGTTDHFSSVTAIETQVRFKPEITAADGTNNTFFGMDLGLAGDEPGDEPFFGQAASAPHAAGVAALLRDPALASVGDGVVDSDRVRVSLDCLAPGNTALSATVRVGGLGAGLPEIDELGLSPVALDVLVSGSLRCPPMDPMAEASWPKTISGTGFFDAIRPNDIDYEAAIAFILDVKRGRYGRVRIRKDQFNHVIVTDEAGYVVLVDKSGLYDELWLLRPGARKRFIEGISLGGGPGFLQRVKKLRGLYAQGVDVLGIIDRIAAGKMLTARQIKALGGKPGRIGFAHRITIRLDTDDDHPAVEILGTAPQVPGVVPPTGRSYVGVFDADTATWTLVDTRSRHALQPFPFGDPNALPVMGDWDGDGEPTVGTYDPTTGVASLRNSNTAGPPESRISFADPGGRPIAGDWDGDGIDDIGLWRSDLGEVRLYHELGPSGRVLDQPDTRFVIDGLDDLDDVLAGDFDGDGRDTIGFIRGTDVYLLDDLAADPPDLPIFSIDPPGTGAGFGDWDGDGRGSLGTFDAATHHIRLLGDGIDTDDSLIFADGFESGDTSAWGS